MNRRRDLHPKSTDQVLMILAAVCMFQAFGWPRSLLFVLIGGLALYVAIALGPHVLDALERWNSR